LSQNYGNERVSTAEKKLENLNMAIKYSDESALHQDYHLLKKTIIEPHFGILSDPEFIVYALIRSNKFYVASGIVLKKGDTVEINVDFGNTYL
jgi:hypothetical protein